MKYLPNFFRKGQVISHWHKDSTSNWLLFLSAQQDVFPIPGSALQENKA
jgi:hypothetical protein